MNENDRNRLADLSAVINTASEVLKSIAAYPGKEKDGEILHKIGENLAKHSKPPVPSPPKRARYVKLTSCRGCPHFTEERHYTEDWFEMAFDWFCKKDEKKQIAGYVEAFDKDPGIPGWCPLLSAEEIDSGKGDKK